MPPTTYNMIKVGACLLKIKCTCMKLWATQQPFLMSTSSGEDRWLCTLLLQQGWRVEYNAASDAYTNSPQEFKEFYNQRRRWGPSTLANTLDLLHRLQICSQNHWNTFNMVVKYSLFSIKYNPVLVVGVQRSRDSEEELLHLQALHLLPDVCSGILHPGPSLCHFDDSWLVWPQWPSWLLSWTWLMITCGILDRI